jgi:hypothetical protein
MARVRTIVSDPSRPTVWNARTPSPKRPGRPLPLPPALAVGCPTSGSGYASRTSCRSAPARPPHMFTSRRWSGWSSRRRSSGSGRWPRHPPARGPWPPPPLGRRRGSGGAGRPCQDTAEDYDDHARLDALSQEDQECSGHGEISGIPDGRSVSLIRTRRWPVGLSEPTPTFTSDARPM